MKKYISLDALVAEIDKGINERNDWQLDEYRKGYHDALTMFKKYLSILKVEDADLIDRKTDWHPSKKQMESLRDLLKYNIGVFDYQKFMEVHLLYDDLTEILNM